jgi:hypothetical protein
VRRSKCPGHMIRVTRARTRVTVVKRGASMAGI